MHISRESSPAKGRFLWIPLLLILAFSALIINRDSIENWRYSKLSNDEILKSAEQQPDNVTLVSLAGKRQLDSGNSAPVKPLILSAARQHPDNAALKVLVARIELENDNLQNAGELLKQALQLEPQNEEALFWSAHQLYRRGRKQMAEEILRQVIQINPQRGDAWLKLGEISLESQDYVAALKNIQHAEKIQPTADSARFEARALFSLGRQDEAEKAARAALKREASADSYALLGRILQNAPEAAKLSEAQQNLKKALELNSGDTETMKSLAIAYRAAGKHRDAIKILRRMIRLAPAMSEGYLLLGQSYQAAGDSQKAAAVLKIFQFLSPLQKRADAARHRVIIERGSLASQLAQVRVLLALGRQDLARDVLNRAWAKAPNNAEIKKLAKQVEETPSLQIPPLPTDTSADAP